MPPWHADPHVGEFSNDRSLTDEQIRTLVHWIEAGAPRGEGADLLAETVQQWPVWAMGDRMSSSRSLPRMYPPAALLNTNIKWWRIR